MPSTTVLATKKAQKKPLPIMSDSNIRFWRKSVGPEMTFECSYYGAAESQLFSVGDGANGQFESFAIHMSRTGRVCGA